MITKKHGTSDDAYSEFYANSHIEGRYSTYIRGARCGDVCDFFKEYSAAFQFPNYFGENWNAWDECACDLDWLMFSSIAIVIDNYDRMLRLTKHPSDEKRHFEECLSRMHEYWTEEAKVPCEITTFLEQGKYDIIKRVKDFESFFANFTKNRATKNRDFPSGIKISESSWIDS